MLWGNVALCLDKNPKTRRGFVQDVLQLMRDLDLHQKSAFVIIPNPTDFFYLKIFFGLTQQVCKKVTGLELLRLLAYETMQYNI